MKSFLAGLFCLELPFCRTGLAWTPCTFCVFSVLSCVALLTREAASVLSFLRSSVQRIAVLYECWLSDIVRVERTLLLCCSHSLEKPQMKTGRRVWNIWVVEAWFLLMCFSEEAVLEKCNEAGPEFVLSLPLKKSCSQRAL